MGTYPIGRLALSLLLALPVAALASEQVGDDAVLEVVIVTGVRVHDELVLESSQIAQTGRDNGELLRMFPGGNRNSNGPVTSISQYRGLFGAQNSVLIDGASYSADCPNWMDTPLSAIPQSLTGSVTLQRGLGSVKSQPEGLGGGIEIRSRNGGFAETGGWAAYGSAEAGSGSNGSAWNAALFTGFHDMRNRIEIAASTDRGDDYEFDGGTVAASEYERDQYRLVYGRQFEAAEVTLSAVINRTGNSGTPALPMDIRFIDSEQYSLQLDATVGPGRLEFLASTLDVDHIMDNFTLRPPPLNAKGKPNYRESAPTGDAQSAKLAYRWDAGSVQLEAGLDGKWESHGHPVSDPTRDAFLIVNFNDVRRDRAGAFGSALWDSGDWDLEAGLRYNRLTMDAGEVGGNLAIPPGSPMYVQQERLDELAAEFNAADRHRSDDQWSGLIKASRNFGEAWRLNLGLGRKVRSPSYQERYLWLPMAATGGLADGRTYIGDIGLEPERSIELTAGFDWTSGGLRFSPEFFYRVVDGFIQGTPSRNQTANRFAMMATGQLPLQYANVDAELYGLDLGYEWSPGESWLLRGNLSWVRGKRTDVPDNLYRIAPLSSFLELLWFRDRWFLSAESVAAASQDRVAEYNGEQETAGWGIVNLRAGLRLGGSFNLGLGVENLFDKVYRDHLGGYNRVRMSDVPLGDRLVSRGRNFYLKLSASW